MEIREERVFDICMTSALVFICGMAIMFAFGFMRGRDAAHREQRARLFDARNGITTEAR